MSSLDLQLPQVLRSLALNWCPLISNIVRSDSPLGHLLSATCLVSTGVITALHKSLMTSKNKTSYILTTLSPTVKPLACGQAHKNMWKKHVSSPPLLESYLETHATPTQTDGIFSIPNEQSPWEKQPESTTLNSNLPVDGFRPLAFHYRGFSNF